MHEAPDDQTDDRRTTTDKSQTGQEVPQEADWEPLSQVPFDPSDSDGLTTAIILGYASQRDTVTT